MRAERIKLPGDGSALICSRGRAKLCSSCRRAYATVMCDGKDTGSRSTCDAPLCPRCSLHVGDKDFCTGHRNQAGLQRSFPFENSPARLSDRQPNNAPPAASVGNQRPP